MPEPPRLTICQTCNEGEGARLADALRDAAGVDLRQVKCLAACDRGCTAAISAKGKWTYLLGRLNPALAGDILAYAQAYAASASGVVLPSRRPASLRHVILGRVPDLENVQ